MSERRPLLFLLLFVTACGNPAPSHPSESIRVPPAPAARASASAPPAERVADTSSDPEPFALELFRAAWSGDEAKVRASVATYEVFSGLSQRELTSEQYREKVDGFLHDFVVPPGATPAGQIAGVKVMRHERFAAGDEKLRRAAELAIVRPILTNGERTEVAPFNFVLLRTENGWLVLPGE